jgi:hypothetical protein
MANLPPRVAALAPRAAVNELFHETWILNRRRFSSRPGSTVSHVEFHGVDGEYIRAISCANRRVECLLRQMRYVTFEVLSELQ